MDLAGGRLPRVQRQERSVAARVRGGWLGGRCTVSVYTEYGCAGESDSALQAAICWDSPGIEVRSFRVEC